MSISVEDIKKLRETTGAGMMDCKKALTESNGNLDEAIKYLRVKGLAKAQKRSGKETGEGVIASYIHPGARLGVLLELNCETDFVSRTDEFSSIAKDIAMHIAAANPTYVSQEDIPQEVIDKEKAIYVEQAKASGKPDNVVEKIAEGKLNKFYEDVCLLNQQFVKNPDITIKDLIAESVAKTGENIKIRRFTRFALGE